MSKTYKSINWQCQSQREILKISEKTGLGPGVYQTKAPFGEGPKYTTGNKIPALKTLNVPGPGFYKSDISVIKDSNPKYKIGTSIRNSEENLIDKKKVVPGPGSYNENDMKKFGKIGIKYNL